MASTTCKICKREFKNMNYLSSHVIKTHKISQEYYDKFIKQPAEGVCKICGNPTEYKSIGKGYENCCSRICLNAYRKKLHTEKYGVENPYQRKDIQDKIKSQNVEKYGVENVFQATKIKDKIKETNKERYGVENPNQNKLVREKIKNTNIERYGVEAPLQNYDIFQKSQVNAYRSKLFKNTNIYYRGSYELDFLEKYYDSYPDIKNGWAIKYNFKEKKCIYFPDFYIPFLNLFVECKNSYLAKIDKQRILAKKKAAINCGFNYIMIIDKNYNKINL
jgi:hypothetical protein